MQFGKARGMGENREENRKAKQPKDVGRDARLRKALRDNLSKRKAQAKARKAEQEK